VVQEAYVRLMDQRKLPVNPRAWLYCAVRNGAISQFRAKGRRRRREQFAAPSELWFEPDAGHWIDGAAARSAMLDLPKSQREIIALRLWGQLTLKEIAQVTGSSTSGVFDQYRAGLNALRKAMGVTCKTEDR
jgi:RNA polymerase sigma factor (sigma-70 family)